jgi:hypothetical protein
MSTWEYVAAVTQKAVDKTYALADSAEDRDQARRAEDAAEEALAAVLRAWGHYLDLRRKRSA